MRHKNVIGLAYKLPLCGIVFFIGMAAGGALLPLLGLQAPAMPEGTDANTIAAWFLLGSLILALPLSGLSRRLAAGFVRRWLLLALLAWVCSAVNMVLEAFFFMDTGATSSTGSGLFTMLNLLLPCVTLSAAVALLFRPRTCDKGRGWRAFWAQHGPAAWAWRLGLVLLAYPVVYIAFGLLVQPFIAGYYAQGAYELTTPTWGQLLPLQLARSALFLLACLPVLIAWRGTKRALFWALGTTIFACVAFMSVITAYWFPWPLRLFHGLELLADSLAYAAVLVALLARSTKPVLAQETIHAGSRWTLAWRRRTAAQR
jgi:hypothetical protein